tara:strand:- start:1177 stop:1881 length:705 start_codon:yes stop_codon:yes gene_type:complete
VPLDRNTGRNRCYHKKGERKLDETVREILQEPLSSEFVSTRPSGGGISLSYIESHHAIREANRAFGFDGWSSELRSLKLLDDEIIENAKSGTKQRCVSYLAEVQVTALGVIRSDVGFGNAVAGISSGMIKQSVHELASKEAVSDAQKRCLRTFGDIFGLALYDKKQSHVVDPLDASVKCIKDALATGEHAKASEAWFELTNEQKKRLWNGGVFSTKEREILKSSEFRKLHFGEK